MENIITLSFSFLASLATQHSDKLLQYELKQQKLLKERQETFGKAFEQDLEQYKQSGRVERLTAHFDHNHARTSNQIRRCHIGIREYRGTRSIFRTNK